IRMALALTSAVIIHLAWSGGDVPAQCALISRSEEELNGWVEIALPAMQTAVIAVIQLALVVIAPMLVMQCFRGKGCLDRFSNMVAAFMRFLGMDKNASTTLVAGLTIGLAYGAGLMIQAVKEDGVSKRDMYLALIFLVSCHAVVEDTLVFLPLG